MILTIAMTFAAVVKVSATITTNSDEYIDATTLTTKNNNTDFRHADSNCKTKMNTSETSRQDDSH